MPPYLKTVVVDALLAAPGADGVSLREAVTGAAFVSDKELVLTYEQTFDAILTGFENAQGATPAEVTLVIWHALPAREFKAALEGLDRASYRHVGERRNRLITTATWLVTAAILLGVLVSYGRRRRRSHSPAVIAIGVLGFAVTIASFKLLDYVVTPLPLVYAPFDVSVLAFCAVFVGELLHRAGAIALGTPDETPPVRASV